MKVSKLKWVVIFVVVASLFGTLLILKAYETATQIKSEESDQILSINNSIGEVGLEKLFNSQESIEFQNSIYKSFPRLENNYSTRNHQVEVDLPNFTVNFTDYALGAVIERESDSYNLYLTTFFICHGLLEPKKDFSAEGALKISPEVVEVWKKAMRVFEETYYNAAGARYPRYTCRITNWEGAASYRVRGEFVPNKLTPDSNSNRRLDVLRCKMRDTEFLYKKFSRSQNDSVFVEILHKRQPIIAFRVLWATRATGYMLSTPIKMTSTWDPWKGYNPEAHGKWSHDDVYLCVPGKIMFADVFDKGAHIYIQV